MTYQSEQQSRKALISNEEFKALYAKQKRDLEVTSFADDVVGFSLVRKYMENTEFFVDRNLMFIRIFLEGEFVCGGVEMVSSKNHKDGRYFLIDTNKYKRKVTGFLFGREEDIVFDLESKKIYSKKEKRSVSINEFIDILVKNHLSDKLSFKRKISVVVRMILIFIFWISDRKYDIMDFFQSDISRSQTQKPAEKMIDPFFKYFKVSRNILLVLTVVIFLALLFLQHHMQSDSFSVSNPIFIFCFFALLFISEKISILLEMKIHECINDKEKKVNFIFRLHSFLHGYGRHFFKLKF